MLKKFSNRRASRPRSDDFDYADPGDRPKLQGGIHILFKNFANKRASQASGSEPVLLWDRWNSPTEDYILGFELVQHLKTEYLRINAKISFNKKHRTPLLYPHHFFWLGGLKYEILAFIRTKNVEKIEITSRKRHRTAYLPEQSS
jgi:hypothetical protein